MSSKKIVIIAFNIGLAGSVVNGPGICLENFALFLNKKDNIDVIIYTELKNRVVYEGLSVKRISDTTSLKQDIKECDVVHHWSGLGSLYRQILDYSNSIGKKVVVGPNVLDTVNMEGESEYLRGLGFFRILTLNNFLKIRISREHNLPIDKFKIFMVGPDIDTWSPIKNVDDIIMWKGNSSQFVKDVDFGIKISKKLNKYNFKFIGYPDLYDYRSHIDQAKNAKVYISTSLSETMGMTLLESWASGVPSVTHPKIYMHGENYKTGIITNRSVSAYCEAIEEIMEDDYLHKALSEGSREFMVSNFSRDVVIRNYLNILDDIK